MCITHPKYYVHKRKKRKIVVEVTRNEDVCRSLLLMYRLSKASDPFSHLVSTKRFELSRARPKYHPSFDPNRALEIKHAVNSVVGQMPLAPKKEQQSTRGFSSDLSHMSTGRGATYSHKHGGGQGGKLSRRAPPSEKSSTLTLCL